MCCEERNYIRDYILKNAVADRHNAKLFNIMCSVYVYPDQYESFKRDTDFSRASVLSSTLNDNMNLSTFIKPNVVLRSRRILRVDSTASFLSYLFSHAAFFFNRSKVSPLSFSTFSHLFPTLFLHQRKVEVIALTGFIFETRYGLFARGAEGE